MDIDFKPIEEITKNPEKIKKYAPFLIAGGGLGLIVYFMNRSKGSQQSVMYEDSTGSDLAGVLADNNAQVENAINELNQRLDQATIAQNDYIMNTMQDFQYDTAQYLKSITEDQKEFQNEITSKLDVKEESLSNSLPILYGSIYYNGLDDAEEFEQITKKINKSDASKSEKDEARKNVAGTGNNGVGWTAEGFKGTESKLKSDSSFLASEKQRVKDVIENRTKLGLDTKAQTDYQKSLENY